MGGRSGQSHVFPARAVILLAAAALLTLVLSPTARAAEGLLDPTFGSGGFTILNEPESPKEGLADVVVLPDGKILAGGTRGSSEGFLLARYNADGTPDLSFGPNGIRVLPDTNTAGTPRGINEIALLGDGRVVAAGLGRGPEPELFDAFAVGRYLPSGVLDPEFGHAGLEGPGTRRAGRSPGHGRGTGREDRRLRIQGRAGAALRTGGAPPHGRRHCRPDLRGPPLRSASPSSKSPAAKTAKPTRSGRSPTAR